MNLESVSILIAVVSLSISAITAWLTLLRRAAVRMTRPTLIYLGPDGTDGPPKVLVSTLLFATAVRGVVVESMHVILYRFDESQAFTRWGFGEIESPRSTGLFVDREGVAANHHFFLSPARSEYQFQAGPHVLETFATIVGSTEPKLLSRVELLIPDDISEALPDSGSALLFTWNPLGQDYDLELLDASDPWFSDAA